MSKFQKWITFEICFPIACVCVANAAPNRIFQGNSFKTHRVLKEPQYIQIKIAK